jgi:hypothetical protein
LVAFLKEWGPWGPEKLIKMTTGQRRRRLRHEAAAAAARCSIALLSRRPSVSPLSKSARRRSWLSIWLGCCAERCIDETQRTRRNSAN